MPDPANPTDPRWDRVAVVGCSGAGKSTLAARLAERLGSTHVELDALYWGPEWTPRPEDEFRGSVNRATAADRWVVDGNYRMVRDLIWQRATTVVWVDSSMATCLGRVLRRGIARAWRREKLWSGNQESLWLTFCSRESLLLWVVRTHGPRRHETENDLALPEHNALHVVRLERPRETQELLGGASPA